MSFQRSVHEIQLRSSWRRIPQPAMQVPLLFSQDSRAQQEKRDLRARRQLEENRDRETVRTRSIARACNAQRAALDWRRERDPAIFLRILLDRASVCFIYSRVCKALPPELAASSPRPRGKEGGGFAGARVVRVPGLKVHVRVDCRVAQAIRVQGRHNSNSPNGHRTL